MKRPKLWSKDFLIDSVTNFIVYLVYYLLMVTIAEYAAVNLKASPSIAGLSSGIFILGALVARVFTGRVIDRAGRKKTLFTGLICFLLTTLLYFAANSLAVLLIVRFLHGASFGVAATATGTIVASMIPKQRHGEGISYYAMSATLASAAGPFLGMLLSREAGFSTILFLSTLLIAAALIAVFFLKAPEAEISGEQLEKLKRFDIDTFFEAKAIPIAVTSIFTGLAFSGILSFLSSYTKQIALVDAGSYFFIVYAASILISRLLTGRMFDKKGENFVMFPAFVLFAIGLALLSSVKHGLPLLLAAAFIGLGYGTFLSCAQAIAIKVSPTHRMGLATSTFFIFIDGGVGFGPFLLGFLIPVMGYRGMYLFLAGVALACSVLYYFLHGKNAATAAVSK